MKRKRAHRTRRNKSLGATKKVTITHKPGQSLAVDKSEVTIYKSKEDQVEWAPSGLNFKVEFTNGSPFKRKKFDRQNRFSKPALPGATVNKTYKYTLTIGGDRLDPGVVVKG